MRRHPPVARIVRPLIFLTPILLILLLAPLPGFSSAYQFIRLTTPNDFFAVNSDLVIRRMDPHAPSKGWTIGEGWGLPPLFYYTKVNGIFDRVDFFYPLGFLEESTFQSRLKFFPFFESRWRKTPPFDGFSRCLTLFQGRSDLGQEYWGFFPFYGYQYRRHGVDKNFFFMFPLYYESQDDLARTQRILWPFITLARSPERQSTKVWPIFGVDHIRNDYHGWYFAWPFFQSVDRFPGTDQMTSYKALPFPLYVREESKYGASTTLLWPFLSYYEHYASGHKRYSFYPFITYGYGGGIDEFNFFYLYSYKTDKNKGTEKPSGYVSVAGDEVFTESKFLFISRIQKTYRKGWLVSAKYRFWPFAEYRWDIEKGSHLKFPEIIPLNNDFWDLNLGRFLSFLDFRETPITRELSLLFGLSKRTEMKQFPSIPRGPKPGDDNWSELVMGSFGKR